MCTAIIAQEILDALQARVSNGSVFSAFDITTDARDGTDERINHKDVKRIVNREFGLGQFPGYNKEVIQLDMMDNPNVIVYYPDGKSASDHPKALKQSAIPTNIPVSPSDSSAPSTPKSFMGGNTKDGDEYICKVTAEGRVNIPENILRQVNAQGGTYDVWFQGKVLYKKPNTDGRLRIAKSELDGGDKFRVRVIPANNTILIEQE
jgi:hypothetical protein